MNARRIVLVIALVSITLLGVCSKANAPPTARIAFELDAGVAHKVTFSARSSSDSDGSIRQYSWAFGDGVGGIGETCSHVYDAPGMYTVTLVVVDNEGRTDMQSRRLYVPMTPRDATSPAGVELPEHVATSHAESGSPDAEVGVPVWFVIAAVAVAALYVLLRRRRVENLSPYEFEKRIASRFREDGWDARVTPATADGGLDIELRRRGSRAIVQCKKWNKPIGVDVVREVYGVLKSERASKAYIVTTSRFTKGASEFARGKRSLELVSGERLRRWLRTGQRLEDMDG